MATPKRPIRDVSPNSVSPLGLKAIKIIKRSPTERKREITDIVKALIEPLEIKLSEAVTENDKLKAQMTLVAQEMLRLKAQNEYLTEWNRGQDKHNRSWNLIFKGFTEVQGETDMDCKKRILQTLQYANIFLQPLSIEKAQRRGIKNKHGSRPIIARF